jgi:hypothetical protein
MLRTLIALILIGAGFAGGVLVGIEYRDRQLDDPAELMKLVRQKAGKGLENVAKELQKVD